MYRIYLAATMGYGLVSGDLEQLAYLNKLREEIDDMKKDPMKEGISLVLGNSHKNVEMNLNTFYLLMGVLCLLV